MTRPTPQVNQSIDKGAPPATRNRVTETSVPSRSLVWAITLGEAILWGTLAWFFADYWMMLPVRYRWGCSLVLVSLAAIGLFRLVKFYRRFHRVKETDVETRTAERRSE